MIVGTAGHIDHGKTTLVRALTGVDTDRLEEEKKRGISIELGYAYMPLDDERILGFIDVPGHERLIHTMAAGATGIDFGLLVVAADDGVMPQTREHLSILSLLGVARGAVALTKVDRVDSARCAAVRGELSTLLRGSFLDGAEIFNVDARAADGADIVRLRDHLAKCAKETEGAQASGLFRLAIDRAFSLKGHGTVVTGTVHGGEIRVADTAVDLRLMPAGAPVRVRSLHAQNHASVVGRAGQRCALNIDLRKDDIARGDWIADVRCFEPSRHIDVDIRLLADTSVVVKSWTPMHVHMGAAHELAHVVPLMPETMAAGAMGRAQLVFEKPMCAMPGDTFILRDAQARATIGGGRVLDPNAPRRRRRSDDRMAWLDGIADFLDGRGLMPLLSQARRGISVDLLARLGHGREHATPPDAQWISAGPTEILISRSHWQAWRTAVSDAVQDFHQSNPDEPGIEIQRLRRLAAPDMEATLWAALIQDLVDAGTLSQRGALLSRPNHRVSLPEHDAALARELVQLIYAGGYDPPWVRDLAHSTQQPEERVRGLLRSILRWGELHQVTKDLFYHPEHMQAMARLVARHEAGIAAAAFRDETGLGRKRAIQILEYFDRIGYTRRLRDRHVLRPDTRLFAESS